jgi:hypothetical protein
MRKLNPGIGGHFGTGAAFNSRMFFLDFGFPLRTFASFALNEVDFE